MPGPIEVFILLGIVGTGLAGIAVLFFVVRAAVRSESRKSKDGK